MKFFIKTRTAHNPAANPKSKSVVDMTAQLLFDNGMTDKRLQAKCSHVLFGKTIQLAKAIQSYERAGKDTDPLLVQQETDLRAVLTKYGITDNDKQEEIIKKYLAFLVEIGG